MLASDIRQLAFEVNNIAITTSALVELLSVDKDKLKAAAEHIFAEAVANATEQTSDEELSMEQIQASGPASHPANAAIFGDS